MSAPLVSDAFLDINSLTILLADRTAAQYDQLLASSFIHPSVCNAVHCGSQGRCTGLKVVPACS